MALLENNCPIIAKCLYLWTYPCLIPEQVHCKMKCKLLPAQYLALQTGSPSLNLLHPHPKTLFVKCFTVVEYWIDSVIYHYSSHAVCSGWRPDQALGELIWHSLSSHLSSHGLAFSSFTLHGTTRLDLICLEPSLVFLLVPPGPFSVESQVRFGVSWSVWITTRTNSHILRYLIF